MIRTIFLFFIIWPLLANARQVPAIIPQPQSMELHDGYFQIGEGLHIVAADPLTFEARFLKEKIETAYGLEIPVLSKKKRAKPSIVLEISDVGLASGYQLHITDQGIRIKGQDATGVFHGVQSLVQMMASGPELPALTIIDYPRFGWRGMHLDCARHFFTVEEVKKYIDYLAMYKMNTFHWHLTEDQGWRIEIKQYPLLTEIGAWRDGSMIGHYRDQKFDSIRYGGFYTQEDIKSVVAYAAQRHINVVPEIEMPGHSVAALAAYPEFSCTGGPFEVEQRWGIFEDVYCAGNDATFEFLENIMDEVLALFPSEYIHIGGDECPKTRWKACEKCQNRIKAEGLADEHELQSYFIQRMEKYLNSRGRKIIGWDEILEGGLAPNAAVMSWRGIKGGIAAAKEGHYVVMSPGNPCYFDHYQHENKDMEPVAIGGFNPLGKVYAYEPVPEELDATESQFVMGAQGNVWTEYMKTFSHVEYMALPRMAALSEGLWTEADLKDYDQFLDRLELHVIILDQMGANYCRHFLTDK